MRLWWRKRAVVFPDGPPFEPATWDPPLVDGGDALVAYPTRELSPRLCAVHSERPETDSYYLNGLVFGPRLTPWVTPMHVGPPVVVTWASVWEHERCLGRRPFDQPVTLKAGVTLSMTLTMNDGPATFEPVPIPTFSRRARTLTLGHDPIAEILGGD